VSFAPAGSGGGGALDAGGLRVVGGAQRVLHHDVGLVDRALHAGGDDRQAGEALALLNAHVGGEDDRVGLGDDRGSSGVEPDEPCVSMTTSTPRRLPAATRESAAM
jgi:hypothetical protein